MSSGRKMTLERDKLVKRTQTAKDGQRLSAEDTGHQKSNAERQTYLPSIESATRSGERIVTGTVNLKDVTESTTRSPQMYSSQHSQSRMHRQGSSGAIVRVESRLGKPHSASKYRGSDTCTSIKNEKSAKRSLSAGKFYLEPLHCPDVDLKSPSKSWEPFSCTCRYCGLKFGKHSILAHEKRCSIKQQKPTLSNETTPTASVNSFETPVARIVTVGLGAIQCEQLTVYACLPPRPETRTLRHSSLRDSGFGLPYVPSSYNQYSNTDSDNSRTSNSDPSGLGMTRCNQCGRVVTADRVSVHRRLCKPDVLQKLSTTSVRFPLTCSDHLKVDQDNSRQPRMTGKKPPSVVCYICGREYGTKSIAIHEPQCLKKFEIENRKLPISKRRPLPKRRTEERAKVVQLTCISKEDQILAVSGHPTEQIDERMDLIFQQCYSDFERELVPCKKCGRKFAPDRHKQHEPKCNAKPLRNQDQYN